MSFRVSVVDRKLPAALLVLVMTNIADLTINQLKSMVAIKEQIEQLQTQLDSLVSGNGHPISKIPGKPRRRMSRAGRARIIAALKARWAKVRGKKSAKTSARKSDRRSSPAVRAKLSAAARARWAKAKAAGKKAL
jgi:hypothetical protein